MSAPDVTAVRVTDRHIAEGVACDGSICPIALAVLAALDAGGVSVAWITVDTYEVTVMLDDSDDDDSRHRFRADLPSRASWFVESFDAAEGDKGRDEALVIAPFEMELSWRELAS